MHERIPAGCVPLPAACFTRSRQAPPDDCAVDACQRRVTRCAACRGFRTIKCLDDFMTVCLWHNSTWYNSNPKVPKMNDAKQFRESLSESITEHDAPDETIYTEMYTSVCKTAFPQARP